MDRKGQPAAPLYGSKGKIPFIYPTNEERAAYNEVLAMFAGAPDQVAILPSQLRSEVELPGVASSFAFNLRSDQPNPGMTQMRSTENRLDINDAFVIREMAVVFGIEVVATAVPAELRLQTFPNDAVVPYGFSTAAPAIQGAYNGKLKMVVNTVEYMSGLDMQSFYYADIAQGGYDFGAGGRLAVSGWKKGNAFRDMVPQIKISGADKAQVIVDLPSALNFGAIAGDRVVAVLLCNGLRVANGGSYRGA